MSAPAPPLPPQAALAPPTPREIFARNRTALAAVGLLSLLTLLAVVGYPLLPDDSPEANRQQPALARLPMATRVQLLALPYAEPPARAGFFDYLWQGQSPRAREHPLAVGDTPVNLRLTADSLYAAPLGEAPLAIARPSGLGERELLITRSYPLGTDALGRCLYSRLVLGGRVTLGIGLLAVVISLSLGTLVGLAAGYLGGWIDATLQAVMTVIWSVPALLLAVAIAFVAGKGLTQLVWAVALSLWVEVARIVRGEIRSLKERPYIEAARVMGLSDLRIAGVHLLPALTGPLVILATSNFATAILLESGLSFLGLGVAPPTPSWGAMVQEGYPYLLIDRGRGLALWPGLALMLTILSLYLIGQALRDALDPRSR